MTPTPPVPLLSVSRKVISAASALDDVTIVNATATGNKHSENTVVAIEPRLLRQRALPVLKRGEPVSMIASADARRAALASNVARAISLRCMRSSRAKRMARSLLIADAAKSDAGRRGASVQREPHHAGRQVS